MLCLETILAIRQQLVNARLCVPHDIDFALETISKGMSTARQDVKVQAAECKQIDCLGKAVRGCLAPSRRARFA